MNKTYILGIVLICGFLFTSVDDCEAASLAEREAAYRAQQRQNSQSGQQQNTGTSQGASSAQEPQQGPGASQNPPAAGSSQEPARPPGQTSPQGQRQPASEQSGLEQPGLGQSVSGQPGLGHELVQPPVPIQEGTPQANQAAGNAVVPGQTAVSGQAAAGFQAITGKEWKLAELHLSGRVVRLDRAKYKAEGAGDTFTMTIDSGRISGKAAPNRYSTAYQAGVGNSLTLLPLVSTLMATSSEPERLHEQEYYGYLSRVKSWRLNQNRLELVTADSNNREVILVYIN